LEAMVRMCNNRYSPNRSRKHRLGLRRSIYVSGFGCCQRDLPQLLQNLAEAVLRLPQAVQNLTATSDVVRHVLSPDGLFITCSASSKALSSSLDCLTMPQTWVMMVGQKKKRVMTVGIACCPKMPMPASKATWSSEGLRLTFKALLIPKTLLNKPPLLIDMSYPPSGRLLFST